MFDKSSDGGFDAILKESIRETIQGIVGEEPGRALLFHLRFPESAERPAEFGKSMRDILLSGSPMVESAIVRRLWDKMGLFLAHADDPGTFEERVEKARDLFSKKPRHGQVFAR